MMRVRYQMVGHPDHAKCDMSNRSARALFKKLSQTGLCEWAELVGEDDDNYMEILDSFDHIKQARIICQVMKEISGMGV